ncbi:MAG: hypothetical protein QOE45_2297 [Frankiaceae bacterium]|nr:hypothetical protein [Frankiaceae bacterium]
MRAGLGRGWVAAAAVASAALVAPAHGASLCPTPGQVVDRADHWTRVTPPQFKVGGAAMSGYDVSRTNADRVMATNGTEIGVTDTGGCSWYAAQLADPSPASAVPLPPTEGTAVVSGSISRVAYPDVPGGAWAIGLVSVASNGLPLTRPRVLRSADSGETFTDVSGGGLPSLGRPVGIHAYDEDVALLLVHATAPTDEYALYRTLDGGAKWSAVWSGLAPLEDFVLGDDGTFWAWDGDTLYRAPAVVAATPPAKVPGIPGAVKTVDVVRNPLTGVVTTSVYLRAGELRYESRNDLLFTPAPAPDGVQSVVHAYDGTVAISSNEANVLVEPGPARVQGALDYSPDDVNLSDVKVVNRFYAGADVPLYGFNALALYRRVIDFVPPPAPPPVDVELEERKPVRPVPVIRPANPVIALAPNERRTVPFTVTLPPAPTPLDVFFMTDSTGSMAEAIGSVQESVQQIVDDLTATGIDLHFGVGDFRDYPETPGNDPNMYPFKNRRVAGPVNAELADALQSIRTGGGTTDGDDAALEAIYQATTGEGRKDPLVTRGTMFQAGQDAKFRKDALKVILVASDDEMRNGFPNPTRPDYPGPTIQQVIAAAKARDVHVVGIAVKTSSASAAKQMEQIATGTDTVAPPGGVDCDGDDVPDLPAGAPLVCGFDPGADGSIAPAFISLLGGIRDYQPVAVRVTGDTDVVRSLADTAYGDLDVKQPHTFDVPVEVRCDPPRFGTESTMRVALDVRGGEVVSTGATIRCAGPPGVPLPAAALQNEPPEIPQKAVRNLAAVALAPPAPAPPVTNINPNPNPNPNPNAGFAQEQQQQGQLALVENTLTPDEELAFSARDRTVPPYPALAWLAAAAMTAAAAFGTQLSRRTSPAQAFDPREHR